MTSPARFRGVAYSGGILRVPGFRDGVVVDLTGLQIPAQIPLMTDHGAGLGDRLGSVAALVEAGQLLVSGTITPGTVPADRAVALLKSGGLSLSIGATPGRVEKVAKGSRVTVNGQTFDGPIEVARDGVLNEVSVVGVGADSSAHAVAARRIAESEIQMSSESITIDEQPDPVLTERRRIQQIHAAFRGINTPEAAGAVDKLIADNSPVIEAERQALALLRASRPSTPGIVAGGPGHSPREVLASSAARLLGAGEYAIRAAGLPAPPARGPSSLLAIAAEALRAEGREVPTSTDRLVRAAFSTDYFSGALASALAVVGLEGFQSAAEPVLRMAHRVPLADFKNSTVARLNGNFKFEPVGPGGEMKYSQVSADATEIKLQTRGTIVRLSREAVINDDKQLLAGVPRELGREAARSIGDEFSERLADDTFFTAARNNYMTGASSILSVDALSSAVAKLRTMRDGSGRVLNLAPKFLLVGAELEAAGRQILGSVELGAAAGEPTANPMRGVAELLVDARIPANQWFLFAGPENAAVVLATLGGNEQPTVEPLPGEADTLGIGWRAYFDYAVGLHEHRAVVKSRGS